MKTTPKTVDEYIFGFPEEVQLLLGEVRDTIKKTAPQAVEVIKYDIPTFIYKGNLVSFAAWKNHISIYPAPREVEEFKKELAAFEGAKSTVKFSFNRPLPLELISRIVKHRMTVLTDKEALKQSAK